MEKAVDDNPHRLDKLRNFSVDMLTDGFLEYLKSERNRSVRTVALYGDALSEFQRFFEKLGDDLTWESVDAEIVRDWIIHLLDEQKQKETTVNLKLSALRTFYHYLNLIGRVKKNPLLKVTGPKKKKTLPAFLRDDEINQLLDAPADTEDFKQVRDHTILLMLYVTGMRNAELRSLRDKDILMNERQIKVTGKRNKQRIIPFGDELAKGIENYWRVRKATFGNMPPEAVFMLDDKGREMNGPQLSLHVSHLLSQATSQKKRSPHVLRHTFATSMLNNGADLQAIQKLLGHESLNTTQIYTHLSFEELKKEYNGAHPRS